MEHISKFLPKNEDFKILSIAQNLQNKKFQTQEELQDYLRRFKKYDDLTYRNIDEIWKKLQTFKSIDTMGSDT